MTIQKAEQAENESRKKPAEADVDGAGPHGGIEEKREIDTHG
ncbi:hypothetical protein QE432_003048 [Agrobacterium sp. SORGH_AS 745]|nr:hypothetical protein [Agrobacterium sp. SORGH_AS_0745]